MDIMSTVGIQPAGGCHYPLAGWSEFARLIQPLLERDNYGVKPTGSVTPPNLKRAWYASKAKDSIALEFDQPIVWDDAKIPPLYLDAVAAPIQTGKVAGNVLTLELKTPSTANSISYLYGKKWDGKQANLIYGANKIAALTFCDVPIVSGP
jgi:hypothetical protein